MKILITMLAILLVCGASNAQERPLPLLPDKDTMLLTVFLKHDQSMNNDERAELIKATGFNDMFPPENVETNLGHMVIWLNVGRCKIKTGSLSVLKKWDGEMR